MSRARRWGVLWVIGAVGCPRGAAAPTPPSYGEPASPASSVAESAEPLAMTSAAQRLDHSLPAGPPPDALIEPQDIPWDEASPDGRTFPATVSTGTHVLIWGGDDAHPLEKDGYAPVPPHPLASGAAYELASGTFTPLPKAPIAGRFSPAVAWTGVEMLVWGGEGNAEVFGDGAAYDPTKSRWRRLARKGSPAARGGMASAWTGTELLVVGGEDRSGAALADARAYDPAANRWHRLPDAPVARSGSRAVWTGTELLLWGGIQDGQWVADGFALDRSAGTWRSLPDASLPAAEEPVVAWTGALMLIWGGHVEQEWLAVGARYDPAADRFTPMGTDGSVPRALAQGVWTGEVLAVVGEPQLDDYWSYSLGLYYPDRDRWWNAEGMDASFEGAVVWTGAELVTWGGFDGNNMLPLGSRVRLPGR